jgi:uncharacterized protein YbjT (DUF2867 family)
MKVILFGATGMIGQGVLRECLLADDVESVLAVGRTPTGQQHPKQNGRQRTQRSEVRGQAAETGKRNGRQRTQRSEVRGQAAETGKLREILHRDFLDFTAIEDQLAGYDACFFCLGVSSAGMSEEDYHRVTYDVTMAAARSLAKHNPTMTFIYVSGVGTDSSERGRSMWARVKGKTENALLELPFRAVMFRPGYVQPMHGIRSRTRLYRLLYAVTTPLYPVVKALAPKAVTSTEQVGRAMLAVARHGAPEQVLHNADINAIQ